MILVDTSVVIGYSRGKDAKLRLLVPSLPVAVCGVTQAELLHGSLDPAHRQKLLADLAAFQPLTICRERPCATGRAGAYLMRPIGVA